MKQNIVGIVGALVAFVSAVLPWWTMVWSASILGYNYSYDVSIYPYQATASGVGISNTVSISIWYGWVALVLVLTGGVLGIAGSLTQRTRMILAAGGLLALLAVVIFAVGLQNELSNTAVIGGYPILGLFSSESIYGNNYTTYLTFGFWLALVAGIAMLVASRIKPETNAPTTVSPPPPPPA